VPGLIISNPILVSLSFMIIKRGKLPMIYPLTERRIAGYDRRNVATVEFKTFESDESRLKHDNVNERRRGRERRQLKLDREKLLESLTSKENKSIWQHINFIWQDFIKPSLIPLVIGGASFYVTQEVTTQQLVSAETIAEQNRENSALIADAELKTQHLMQMAKMFSNIINLINLSPAEKKTTEDTFIQQVKSLSVYGDEALPFLLQIRDEYKGKLYDTKSERSISDVAKTTIENILKLNQHQIKMNFIGEKDHPLNLPGREYIDYNLGGSTFKDVNLYEANFSKSSLQDAKFIDVDLRKADFSNASLINATFENTDTKKTRLDISGTRFDHANLENAKFIKVNLSNVSFNKTYLKNVSFEECMHIEKAKFSMQQLVSADIGLLNALSGDQYALLLMKYEKNLIKLHGVNAKRLGKVYEKLKLHNLNDIDELLVTFRGIHKPFVERNPTHMQSFLARF
jgi:uncharacterized protein YjbI with pentapeptide repeats